MAAKHIPGTKAQTWLKKKWLVETISSVPPVLVAAVAAYRLWIDGATQTLGYWSAGAAVWLAGGSIVKVLHAKEQDKDAAAKQDHDGLRAALWVLHATAGHACGIDPGRTSQVLRVTFHRVVPPVENAQEIEQIVPYVGGAGNGSGRKFSIRSGITGRCIRTKQPLILHRDDNDVRVYRHALTDQWAYTEHDAAKVAEDRFSLMAVPVLDSSSQHALGVIYVDGTEKDMFVDDAVQSILIEACGGVTRYVSERY